MREGESAQARGKQIVIGEHRKSEGRIDRCAKDRARERKREREKERERACVWVRMRDRERTRVTERERARARECVCMCVREGERGGERQSTTGSVCV